MASQVDEVFYFDSIMHGHHIYVQDSVVSVYSRAATILLHSSPSVASTVWSLQQAGEIVSHIPSKLSQTVNLQRKRAWCRMFSSFLLWQWPFSVHRIVSPQLQASAPCPFAIMNVILCGIYSRAGFILLRSSPSPVSIRGGALNKHRKN